MSIVVLVFALALLASEDELVKDEIEDALHMDAACSIYCNDDSDHDMYSDVYGYLDFDELEETDLVE